MRSSPSRVTSARAVPDPKCQAYPAPRGIGNAGRARLAARLLVQTDQPQLGCQGGEFEQRAQPAHPDPRRLYLQRPPQRNQDQARLAWPVPHAIASRGSQGSGVGRVRSSRIRPNTRELTANTRQVAKPASSRWISASASPRHQHIPGCKVHSRPDEQRKRGSEGETAHSDKLPVVGR